VEATSRASADKTKKDNYYYLQVGEEKVRAFRHTAVFAARAMEIGNLEVHIGSEDKSVEITLTTETSCFEGTGHSTKSVAKNLKEAEKALNADILKAVHKLGAFVGYEFEE
jgi:hypothetical protein